MSTAATITFIDLEWRSYSIMADAGQAVACVRQHSKVAIRHWKILSLMNSIAKGLREGILDLFHQQDKILALEAASAEDLAKIVAILSDVRTKVAESINSIHSLDGKIGYWQRLYNPRVRALEQLNAELGAHIVALSDTTRILLTNRDQAYLTKALLRPAEPNDALRKAFSRK